MAVAQRLWFTLLPSQLHDPKAQTIKVAGRVVSTVSHDGQNVPRIRNVDERIARENDEIRNLSRRDRSKIRRSTEINRGIQRRSLQRLQRR